MSEQIQPPRPEHPYASFIHKVKKPAQYLGGEHAQIRKDWSSVDGRMCLAFPDLYEVGMSHLGYRILYSILNKHPKTLAERCYAPWGDMEKELRAHGEPLRSLETWRPLKDFDVVGFSLQFELTYTNVLLMMDLGGIPLRGDDRGEDDPLIVCGGPVSTHAEPLAPFIDAFLIGDGEERTMEILLAWTTWKRAGMPRKERLAALSQFEGIYVPSIYPTVLDPDTGFHVVEPSPVPGAAYPISRAFLADINKFPFPHDSPVATTETVFDRVSVEIARGCTEGCRFCQAGMIYRPVREREPTSVVNTIRRAIEEGGYEEASLTSLSTADYSAIAPLVEEVSKLVKAEKVSLSISSLRAYGLGEQTLDDLNESRAGGLTFAPEAGTQRMRDVVNKNVTEEQLMETARRVFSRGWNKMKLYFMIGLPTEEDEDVRGIVETGARAHQVGRQMLSGRKKAEVVVAASTHVPKPHTPFQWCAMDDHPTIVRKQQLLKNTARNTGIKLRMHDSEGSWLEGVLARGDRSLANMIEDAYRNGARFDSWQDCLKLDVWQAAVAKFNVQTGIYLGTIPVDARLPWDHIDVGLEEGFLAREYRKALKNRLSPPCGKVAGTFVHHTNLEAARADANRLVCYDCGVACDLDQMKTERIGFLTNLGAEKQRLPVIKEKKTRPKEPVVEGTLLADGVQAPESPAPETEPADGTAAEPRGKRGGRKPPQARYSQGHPTRVRLALTKTGRMAFHGHLDLVRFMPRILRRAKLPMYYSIGFVPRPVLVFGPALSLGVSALCEYVDLKLDGALAGDVSDLHTQLNAATEEGIHFLGSRVLGNNDRAINRLIDQTVYVAGLPKSTLAAAGVSTAAELTALIAERRTKPLVVRRKSEGIGRDVRVSDYLLDVQVGEGRDSLLVAGIVGDLLPVTINVRLSPTGGAKASEVVDALLGVDDSPARLVRVGLYGTVDGERVSPLEIERFRIVPSHHAAAGHDETDAVEGVAPDADASNAAE